MNRDKPGKPRKKKVKPVKKLVEFIWTDEQQKSFDIGKDTIMSNAVFSAEVSRQYHVSANASKRAWREVLFQILNHDVGTKLIVANR